MMKKEYVMQVVETIRELLVALVPTNALISWGLKGFIATVFENMPALKFYVSGRMYTGFVIIEPLCRLSPERHGHGVRT